MRPIRVVYDNQPYLVLRNDDGSLDRAYGPFSPGVEPALGECGPDSEVKSARVLATLVHLLPVSPALPSNEGTLAGH